MVKMVLKYLLWAMIAGLIIIFLVGGGIGKAMTAAKTIGNPLTSAGGAYFMLPWQVPIPQGPDISPLVDNASASQPTQATNPSEAQTLGETSPYQNAFALFAQGAQASDPAREYIIVQNNGQATIDITGWSLQSTLSGVRAYIPKAASFFESGAINTQSDIQLAPGGSVVMTSGSSPVGTSFRENECSGYLEDLQDFTPALSRTCPDPTQELALAQSYGDSCAQFVQSLNQCSFPQNIPSSLSLGCQQFLQVTYSYNGCVQEYGADARFASNSWRAYFNSPQELWRNDRDSIRLLDAQGQVVSVVSY